MYVAKLNYLIIFCLLVVIVTVDNSVDYTVNENEGPVNITLLLDQPSCGPITIIARPQERSSDDAASGNIIHVALCHIKCIRI